MSYIYDGFPTWEAAENFAAVAANQYDLPAIVFADQASANRHCPFPYVLTAPIVHVDRPVYGDEDEEIENLLEREAVAHGGEYAGT